MVGAPRCHILLLLLASTVGFLRGTVAARDRENTTSWGEILWATADGKTEALWSVPTAPTELVGDDTNQDSNAIGEDDVDGAFSSLDGMLQWAIGRFNDDVSLHRLASIRVRIYSVFMCDA